MRIVDSLLLLLIIIFATGESGKQGQGESDLNAVYHLLNPKQRR